MIKEVKRYSVLDAHGSKLQIICYQEYLPAGTLDNPNAVVPGLQYLEDMNRNKVNQISESQFQVVTTGELLTLAS